MAKIVQCVPGLSCFFLCSCFNWRVMSCQGWGCFFVFFGWPIKTVPCVLNTVLHWPPKAYLLTVVFDEVYVLVSQPKMKTLLKQHFWGEQPIKTLNTVNDLKLLSSDRKLYPKLSALLCFSDSRAADWMHNQYIIQRSSEMKISMDTF